MGLPTRAYTFGGTDVHGLTNPELLGHSATSRDTFVVTPGRGVVVGRGQGCGLVFYRVGQSPSVQMEKLIHCLLFPRHELVVCPKLEC